MYRKSQWNARKKNESKRNARNIISSVPRHLIQHLFLILTYIKMIDFWSLQWSQLLTRNAPKLKSNWYEMRAQRPLQTEFSNINNNSIRSNSCTNWRKLNHRQKTLYLPPCIPEMAFAMYFGKKWFLVDRRCAWKIFLLQNKNSTAKLTLAYRGTWKAGNASANDNLTRTNGATSAGPSNILKFLRAFRKYLPHCQLFQRCDEQLET